MNGVLRWAPWIVVPIVVGGFLGTVIDTSSLPFIGTEHIEAVSFVDGQTYFGHLDDNVLSGTMTLTDVYYLDDSKGRGTDYDAAVVKRGSELHQPADGMRVRREHVLLIERIGLASPVASAIEAQRALEKLK